MMRFWRKGYTRWHTTYKRECHRALFDHFFAKTVAGSSTAEIVAAETANLAKIRECRLTFGPRPAQRMWIDLGLGTNPEMFVPPRQIDMWMPPTDTPAQ